MKQAIWLLFIAVFLLSISAVFAQSDASAVSPQDENAVQITQKSKRVVDIRKVVIYGSAVQSMNSQRVGDNVNQFQKAEITEEVQKAQYDEKGGLIVPNASKGIRITPQSSKKTAKIEKALKRSSDRPARLNESTENQKRYKKDLSSRGVESSVKTKKQKDN